MRYVKGEYKRDLPRTEPGPGDVFVCETWHGPQSRTYYVCDAMHSGGGESVRLSQGFDTRRAAVDEAWRILADVGCGRLLHGRAEVPIRWSLTFRRDAPPECRERYGRNTTGERHLATALRHWAGLPKRTPIYVARAVVAKGYMGATFPLTQTETRAALAFDPNTLRPMAREAFAWLDVCVLGQIPEALRSA